MRCIAALKQDGKTLVLITHRPSLLAGIDNVLMLREGVAEMFGPRAEVLSKVTRANAALNNPVVAGAIAPRIGG
jgi:ATP-binding cassette subfamily C protein/ATP-binding cassette subfamily C protein EexD